MILHDAVFRNKGGQRVGGGLKHVENIVFVKRLQRCDENY